MRRPPHHLLVPGTARHGVTILAAQLAAATGAATVTDAADRPPGSRLHLHLTDRLLGAAPEQAAEVVAALAARHPLTVTLHDVPQPTDGDAFERRRDAYTAMLREVAGWAVSSHTERRTVTEHCRPALPGEVVPLPLVDVAAPRRTTEPRSGPLTPGEATIGVFGWVYPGKGHLEALAAAALLGASPEERPTVLALGAVAAGHDDLADVLAARAAHLRTRLTLTGWLDDAEAAEALRTTTVGLVAHGNVSASGSLNSWVAAGRRPLVRDSDYTREMADLRPGTLELYPADATPAELARRLAARLDDPTLNDLDGPAPGPYLADAARAYLAWWSG